MIFNPFWITLTELLVVPGTSSTSPVSAPDIYIYKCRYIFIYIYIHISIHTYAYIHIEYWNVLIMLEEEVNWCSKIVWIRKANLYWRSGAFFLYFICVLTDRWFYSFMCFFGWHGYSFIYFSLWIDFKTI